MVDLSIIKFKDLRRKRTLINFNKTRFHGGESGKLSNLKTFTIEVPNNSLSILVPF